MDPKHGDEVVAAARASEGWCPSRADSRGGAKVPATAPSLSGQSCNEATGGAPSGVARPTRLALGAATQGALCEDGLPKARQQRIVEIVRIEGAGHQLYIESPGPFNEALLRNLTCYAPRRSF